MILPTLGALDCFFRPFTDLRQTLDANKVFAGHSESHRLRHYLGREPVIRTYAYDFFGLSRSKQIGQSSSSASVVMLIHFENLRKNWELLALPCSSGQYRCSLFSFCRNRLLHLPPRPAPHHDLILPLRPSIPFPATKNVSKDFSRDESEFNLLDLFVQTRVPLQIMTTSRRHCANWNRYLPSLVPQHGPLDAAFL